MVDIYSIVSQSAEQVITKSIFRDRADEGRLDTKSTERSRRVERSTASHWLYCSSIGDDEVDQCFAEHYDLRRC